MSIQLNANYEVHGNAAGTQTSVFGMIEPLGLDLAYTTFLYGIYRYLKVTAVTIQVHVSNQSTVPVNVVLFALPFSAMATVTPLQATNSRGSVKRVLSAVGGMDRANLSKTYDAQTWFGSPNFEKYWVTATQAALTTPIDVNEPAIGLLIDNVYAASNNYLFDIKLIYHVQFFDLNNPL